MISVTAANTSELSSQPPTSAQPSIQPMAAVTSAVHEKIAATSHTSAATTPGHTRCQKMSRRARLRSPRPKASRMSRIA